MHNDSDSSKETNDFVLVTAKLPTHSTPLLNPLYHTITVLKKDNDSFVDSLQIQHNDGQNGAVFYISLTAAKNPLFNTDFQFKEGHLTVNQHYRTDKKGINNGLSTIHYTESYGNQSSKEQVVIHVYFSKQGFWQYHQAKLYPNNQSREKGRPLILTPEQVIQIRENIEEPAKIVKYLIEKNGELYVRANQASDIIDNELQLMYQHKISINDYISKAKTFIESINQINLLSYTSKDHRGTIMAAQIENMKHIIKDFTDEDTIEKSEQDDEGASNSQAAQEIKEISAKNDKKKRASQKYQELELLVKRVTETTSSLKKQPNDVSLLIEQRQLLHDINIHLLLLTPILTGLTKHRRKILEKWTSITYQTPNLVDVFFEHFWTGNLNAVQELYPLVGHLILPQHIITLLRKLTDDTPEENRQQALKEVFNFLYKSSSLYQLLLSCSNVLMGNLQTSNGIFISVLLRAYYDNNLFAYELLLEHGVHPNSVGIAYKNWHIPNISILSITSNNNQAQFLGLAIQYGGHYTTKPEHVEIDARKSSKGTAKILKHSLIVEDIERLCKYTLLDLCCSTNNYEAIHQFIPQLSFEHTLEALSHLTMKKTVYKRSIIPSLEPNCWVALDPEALKRMQERVIDYQNQAGFFSILIHSQELDTIKVIEELLTQAKRQLNSLVKDLPTKLRELQVAALAQLKALSSSPKNSSTNYKLDYALFLLILDPDPKAITYQSLLQVYCYIAAYFKSQGLFNHVSTYYQIAKDIAEGSCFADELQSTPLYTFISNKLDTLGPGQYAKSYREPLVRIAQKAEEPG